ncbi:DUF397 domain-containing protein [Streptomyces sp. NPDC054784]
MCRVVGRSTVSVDVELCWHKSSYSSSQGDDCVEVARARGLVHVRDSKDVSRPGLRLSTGAWSAFLARGDRP